jgi:ketosteroid isomerase-like protein
VLAAAQDDLAQEAVGEPVPGLVGPERVEGRRQHHTAEVEDDGAPRHPRNLPGPRRVGPERDATRHDDAVSSDAEAVRALVVAYAERLDAGDLDGVAALFEDAVVRPAHSGAVLVGRDAVRRMYDPVILYEDGTPRTKHVLANHEVAVDEAAGTATSQCVFTVLGTRADGGLGPLLAGRYEDRFARVDGRWRFVERIIVPDLVGDLSTHMRR